MKNYTVTYEMDSEPSELYTWAGPGACIGDVLFEFYKGEPDFNYELPRIINIEEH